MADQNPWQVLIDVWRNTILAFWRLPLLILGCFLLYPLLSGYWSHYLPFDVPRGFASQAGYELIHALVFAPLVLGVMLTVVRHQVRYTDIWTASAISIGVVIALREITIWALEMSLSAGRSWLVEGQFFHPRHPNYQAIALAYALPGLLLLLCIFLLSVRLILLLPVLGLENVSWKAALSNAWRRMRGRYGLALAVSFAAILPVAVAERPLAQLYRRLDALATFPGPLSLERWEALMVRSAEFTLQYIMTGALAAVLYLTIRAESATAPSPSHKSPAHRPAA
jgi:hypothetical protein